MRAARNRAIELTRYDKRFRLFTPELASLLRSWEEAIGETDLRLDGELADAQLRLYPVKARWPFLLAIHPRMHTI